MLQEFWGSLGGRLAERWLTQLLSPALAFWVGGLLALAWNYAQKSNQRSGIGSTAETWSDALKDLSILMQGAALLGLLIAVTLSAIAVQGLARPTLRMLAGDWPLWLEVVGAPVLRARRRLNARRRERLRKLAAKNLSSLSPKESRRRRRLEREYKQAPAVPSRQTATRLGNVLRAYEDRPAIRYGLDASTCWPHLWLLLPEPSRRDIGEARARLSATIQSWLWGILFISWTPLAWWALPLGLLVAAIANHRTLSAATTYGEMFAASFDVHRRLLYAALRWPLPASPAEEPRIGANLTRYLKHGSHSPEPYFTTTDNLALPRGTGWAQDHR
jgi:hypothetical protein